MTGPETLHDGGEGPLRALPPPPPADPGELHAAGEGPALIVPPDLPADSPGQEDVLGLRISAALIDLVVLGGLFTITASVAGRVSAGVWSFTASLSPGWSAAFVAVAMLYYCALEAWCGQTVGKRLLRVQVYGRGRTRPSAWAVAARTLLRLVDFLPVMHLAGFVTMMAAGARRQRIGGLAARTAVARAAPARRRGRAAVPLAAVLVAAAGLSACGAASPETTLTYRGHGVSFDYPAGWQERSGYTSHVYGGGAKLWSTAVGPGTQYDGIGVAAYRTRDAVTAQDIDAAIAYLESLLQQAGMTVQGTPDKITVAGLPGRRLRVTRTVAGTRLASTLVFAYTGTTEYQVNCESTAGMAAQVQQACDQVTGSFHVSGAAGSGGLGAKVVPAPAGFALAQGVGVHNGPMSAARFNQWTGGGNLAASLHFVRGYDVTYDSNTSADTIEVTLFQFATAADAASFKAGQTTGGLQGRPDPVIPGGDDIDSTVPYQGIYAHSVIATKGNLAFVIDYPTGSAAHVSLLETMARQQYAAL